MSSWPQKTAFLPQRPPDQHYALNSSQYPSHHVGSRMREALHSGLVATLALSHAALVGDLNWMHKATVGQEQGPRQGPLCAGAGRVLFRLQHPAAARRDSRLLLPGRAAPPEALGPVRREALGRLEGQGAGGCRRARWRVAVCVVQRKRPPHGATPGRMGPTGLGD